MRIAVLAAPRALFALAFSLVLALASARPGPCAQGQWDAMLSGLEKARQGLVSLSPANAKHLVVEQRLAEARPVPGWRDVSFLPEPAFSSVGDVLELLTAARALGFLDRRDATARQVLWEIAGRCRLSGQEGGRWMERFRALMQPVSELPYVREALDSMDARAAGAGEALENARRELTDMVLAGGPSPEGRPLLAERSEAYLALMKRLDALEPQARELAARHGAAIQYDWPGRIAAVRSWARRREDLLGMALAAGLTKDSPRQALEYTRDFTNDSGWAMEDITESVCRPFDWKPQIPSLEQTIAGEVCDTLATFYNALYKKELPLANETSEWVPRR